MTQEQLLVVFGLFYVWVFGAILVLGLEVDRWLRQRAARRRFE